MNDAIALVMFLLLAGTPAPPGKQALGVEELMRDAAAQRGRVRVAGVVATHLPDRKGLGLVDAAGCATSCAPGCSRLVLPVWWSGTLPALESRVVVEGRVEKRRKKRVFVASSLVVSPLATEPESEKEPKP